MTDSPRKVRFGGATCALSWSTPALQRGARYRSQELDGGHGDLDAGAHPAAGHVVAVDHPLRPGAQLPPQTAGVGQKLAAERKV